MPGVRQWLPRVAVIGIGALAGLLLCEIVLRIQEQFLHIVDGKDPINAYPPHARHSVWHHWVLPHTSVTVQMRRPDLYPKPFIYTTNDFGCRYPKDLAGPKPNGVRRILVLGDSFAEGFYYEDTVGYHLERRLNQSFPGLRLEVVNCACGSYSPLLEYLRLKNQLIQMQPDEIILLIDQTDIFDDYWRYRPFTRLASDGEPLGVRENYTWKREAIDWAGRRSYLVRFLSRLRWWLAARLGSSHTYGPETATRAPTPKSVFGYFSTLPIESEAWQREVGFCLTNILRIIHFTQERGILLTVTIYPHRQHLKADPGEKPWHHEFEHRVEQLCHENGVHFFSAFDGITSAYLANHSIYFEDDMHFTPPGQRIWADLITDDYFVWLQHRRGVPRGLAAVPATR